MQSRDLLIRQHLSAWLDEEAGDEALRTACDMAGDQLDDIAALLDWLGRYRCDPRRRAHAMRAMRSALRRPTMPGPVCRS